jgi:hypothetical protein
VPVALRVKATLNRLTLVVVVVVGGGGGGGHQVVGVVGFAAVGGFLFGYDTGVVGGAILLIQEQFDLSSLLVETVISIALVGTDPILHAPVDSRAHRG